MSAVKLPPAEAFTAGADLWIMKNDPDMVWWKKIDLQSGYLLSENLLHKKKEVPPTLQNILNATHLQFETEKTDTGILLIGTEDHFFNKWLLLWHAPAKTDLSKRIQKTARLLGAQSLRIFGDEAGLWKELGSGLTTSSFSISYIENN